MEARCVCRPLLSKYMKHEKFVLVVFCLCCGRELGKVGFVFCVSEVAGYKVYGGMTHLVSPEITTNAMRSEDHSRLANQDSVMPWSPVTLYPSHQSSLAKNGYNLELGTIHHVFCKPRAETSLEREIFLVQNAHALMIIAEQTLDNHTNITLP